jgi:hypothetical protein
MKNLVKLDHHAHGLLGRRADVSMLVLSSLSQEDLVLVFTILLSPNQC